MNTYGLSVDHIASALRTSVETVNGWMDGTRRCAPYLDHALRAAKIGLQPVAAPIALSYARQLGVCAGHAKYWKETGQVPVPFRMAVSWIIHKRVTGRDI